MKSDIHGGKIVIEIWFVIGLELVSYSNFMTFTLESLKMRLEKRDVAQWVEQQKNVFCLTQTANLYGRAAGSSPVVPSEERGLTGNGGGQYERRFDKALNSNYIHRGFAD